MPAISQNAQFNSTTFAQTFTHHTANVNGLRLHYVMGGKGDPVVLLHGFPQTWYEWHHVMPALAEHYTVIAPDLRGLGESSKPETGYDATTVAEDVFQLVNRLGFQKINLVGHDIAGGVAYAYAAKHANAVQRLVILESTIPGFEAPETASRLGGVWHPAFHQEPDLPEALVFGRERTYLKYFFTKYAYDKTAVGEDDLNQYVRDYSAPRALKAALAHYRAFPQTIQQNQQYAKTKLQMPVLALGGESVLGDLVLKSVQRVATNVRGGTIPQCGHWIATERPEYLVDQLFSFFSQAT
jgi:pimeloyl-ACP methyl ester carboxylesterase